jgi:hypothetical protein
MRRFEERLKRALAQLVQTTARAGHAPEAIACTVQNEVYSYAYGRALLPAGLIGSVDRERVGAAEDGTPSAVRDAGEARVTLRS